jgi:hypothetical protein
MKGEKCLPLVQTEGCDPLTERLNVAFDEVFGCSQGRVGLDLARRCDRFVDTCPDVAACGGGLGRAGLSGHHIRCFALEGGDCGGG